MGESKSAVVARDEPKHSEIAAAMEKAMVGMACARPKEPDVLTTRAPSQRMGTSEVLMPEMSGRDEVHVLEGDAAMAQPLETCTLGRPSSEASELATEERARHAEAPAANATRRAHSRTRRG